MRSAAHTERLKIIYFHVLNCCTGNCIIIIIYNVMSVSTGCILMCIDRGPWSSGIVHSVDSFSFVFLFLNNVIQGNFNVYTIVPSLNLTSFPSK